MNTDDWFKRIREKYAGDMQCGKGCTACCYGLFDISLADAVEVARGFEQLSNDVQQEVYARAAEIQRAIGYTLFPEDDPRIDEIVEAANSPRCPLLGDAGECLIYDYRPLACRLEGVPMVDAQRQLFGDWCELNFKDGVPETALTDLQCDYDSLDVSDESRSAAVARQAGIADHGAITFIPTVIAKYAEFWKRFIS
jgi:Fe-S-cluster containining protein